MTTGKINRKYFPIIWIALLVACFVRNAYAIYYNVVTGEIGSPISIFLFVLETAFINGAIPMLVTVFCAMIVWQIGAARYVRCISRTDFCYLIMSGVAAVNFVVGIIEIFSILQPGIQSITSTVLQLTLMTGVMLALFFYIAKAYRLNPVEKYNAFRMWFMIYMIVVGIETLVSNSMMLAMADGGTQIFGGLFLDIMYEMGYMLVITPLQVGASIAAISVYFAYLIAVIVLGEMMRKQSEKFRNPETRGDYYDQFDNRAYKLRGDADSVFDGSQPRSDNGGSKDEKVFDEFDI